MRPKGPTAPKRKTKGPDKVRNRTMYPALLRAFKQRWPNFRVLDVRTQLKLLQLMRAAFQKHRQHADDPNTFWWHYTERDQTFGRGGFEKINKLLGLFEVGDQYFSGEGDFETARRETKPYRLVPDAERIYFEEMSKKPRGRLGKVIDMNGKAVLTLPRAVQSRDVNGNTAKVWRNEAVPQLVPVSIEALDAVAAKWDTGDLYTATDPNDVQYRRNYTLELRKAATTAPAGRGFVAHQYVEAGSGRLTATGINLQSAPRSVRKAALVGLWDYDFENCHYAILEQLAARYGHACPKVANYNQHKEMIRKNLMDGVELDKKQAKEALIALVYGAKLQESRFVALYKAVGHDKAKLRTLIHHRDYKALKRDVAAAGKAILAGWKPGQRSLVNGVGKPISLYDGTDRNGNPKPTSPAKLLAHLLQGAEAAMLKAAFRLYPDKIVLLVHDGFVATEPLDTSLIQAEVLRVTGYRMKLSGERIAVDLDA